MPKEPTLSSPSISMTCYPGDEVADPCLVSQELNKLSARIEELEAKFQPRTFTAEEVKPIVAPTTTTSDHSLVELIIDAMLAAHYKGGGRHFQVPHPDEIEAMILTVASWIQERHDSDQLIHTAWEAGWWLKEEVAQ